MNRRDPTRSAGLRKRGRALVNRRVFELHSLLRQALHENDYAGLRVNEPSAPTLFINWLESMEYKLARAEGVIDQITTQSLVMPVDWPRDLIERSVQHGVDQVEQELRTSLDWLDTREVSRLHATEAFSEVRGIAGETQRRLLRHVVRALETKATPTELMREIRRTIEKITRLRLHLMVNTSVVRSVNAGKLLGYEALGIRQVGIAAEWLPASVRHRSAHVGDSGRRSPLTVAALIDAKRRKKKRKRVEQKKDPEEAALEEIMPELAVALEQALEAVEPVLVNVLTAGDDLVCQDCEDIAGDGPYDLDTAKGLIPAHPNCRCAFVPFGDERFAAIMEQEELE